MKKTLLLFCLVLLFGCVTAQNKLSFGVKLNGSLMDWKWNIYPEPSGNGFGITVGGIIDYRIIEKASLRAELDYSIYEFRVSSNNGYHSTFLEIPVMLNANISNRFTSYFGLGVGFKMSDFTFWSSSDGTLDQIPILDSYKPEYFKSVNIFFPVGITYNLGNGLFADLRMNLNMNDMGNSDVDFAKGFNSYNLGIVYKFNLK